jgi:hypothetical protein
MSLTIEDKVPIRFERLNSKYNRLWDQLTNICIFVFGSLVAYSIAYIDYCLGNSPEIALFLSRIIIPLIISVFSSKSYSKLTQYWISMSVRNS